MADFASILSSILGNSGGSGSNTALTQDTIAQAFQAFANSLQGNQKSWLDNISNNGNLAENITGGFDQVKSFISKAGGTTKNADITGAWKGGLKSLKDALPTNAVGYGNLIGTAADIGLNAFGVKKTDAAMSTGFDKTLNTIDKLPLQYIPVVGQAAKVIVKGLNLANQFGGNSADKQGTKDMVNTGRETYQSMLAGKKQSGSSRLWGAITGNSPVDRANGITNLYEGWNLASSASSYLNQQNQLAANNTMSTIYNRNIGQLLNNNDTRVLAAKSGAKIEYMQSGKKFLNLIKNLTGKNEKTNSLYTPSNGQDADCEECAKFQNEILRNSGYATSGNAWDLNRVKDIFNAYDPEKRPSNYSRDSVEMYNQDAANRFLKEFDSNTLDTTKTYVANMYYKGSPYQEQAFNEGNNVAGTHTGYLRWKQSDGTNKGFWENVHNISGTVHVEPFVKTQGGNRKWGVTSLYEPEEKNIFDKTKDSFKNVQRIASKVKVLKSGGKMNVIPDGAFHSRKHDLPEEISKEVTNKGIPVITKEDGEIVQHAEIERNEIIFHKELTNKLEELLKQYNSETNQKKKDEIAIKAGKLLKKEILYNTKDNTGLLEKVE